MRENKELSSESFLPLDQKTESNRLNVESVGYWQDVWRRFRSNKAAVMGLVCIVLITLLAMMAPMISSYDYQTQDLPIQNQESASGHYFGTDHFGRDLWTRTWYGARISLLIAALAALLNLVIGITFGGVSGYFGGRVDLVMQRIIEILYGVPELIVITLMLIVLKPGIVPIAIALSITGWVPMARIVRAQILKLKSQEYILAARTLGASHKRILLKHLIPNVMGPIIIAVTFAIPTAIFFEAFLSFIGLGIRPPEASLGVLLNDAKNAFQIYPYQIAYPGAVLCLIMLCFNIVGDALRDALDPRMRK